MVHQKSGALWTAPFGTGNTRTVYIVVTTLNGELLVCEWNPVNAQFGGLVHSKNCEGPIGDLSTTKVAKPKP